MLNGQVLVVTQGGPTPPRSLRQDPVNYTGLVCLRVSFYHEGKEREIVIYQVTETNRNL